MPLSSRLPSWIRGPWLWLEGFGVAVLGWVGLAPRTARQLIRFAGAIHHHEPPAAISWIKAAMIGSPIKAAMTKPLIWSDSQSWRVVRLKPCRASITKVEYKERGE